jgi:hypothetical protein
MYNSLYASALLRLSGQKVFAAASIKHLKRLHHPSLRGSPPWPFSSLFDSLPFTQIYENRPDFPIQISHQKPIFAHARKNPHS